MKSMTGSQWLWRVRLVSLVLFGIASVLDSGRCSGEVVYLALGDSVTFGLDLSDASTLVPSPADQGFVKPFADHLATRHGGTRPLVKNLAIPGELSSSFFSGSAPAGWLNRIPQLNSNYSTPPETQHQLMLSSIDDIFNSGDSVGYVSILLGSNDVFYLTGTAEFQNAAAGEQQMMLAQTIDDIFANYNALLQDVTTRLPEAEIYLPNYYNPYASSMDESLFYEQILAVFNPAVEQLAQAYGAKYVDLYSVFNGRHLGIC